MYVGMSSTNITRKKGELQVNIRNVPDFGFVKSGSMFLSWFFSDFLNS